jgi:hypothetical protein
VNASPSFDASQVAVKTALLVDTESRREVLLLDSLSASTEAANKVFDRTRAVKWPI